MGAKGVWLRWSDRGPEGDEEILRERGSVEDEQVEEGLLGEEEEVEEEGLLEEEEEATGKVEGKEVLPKLL